MLTFGQTIYWTLFNGSECIASVYDYQTYAGARAAAELLARHHERTPPKWWQWW